MNNYNRHPLLNGSKRAYAITLYTEDQTGLLTRIVITFSRRRINIESINGSPSVVSGIYRLIIVVTEAEAVVRKLCPQLEKQIAVLKVYYSACNGDHIAGNTNDHLCS